MASLHRNAACSLSCLVVCLSYTALATLITLFATSVLVDSPVHHQALTAAILDIITLACLLVFVVFHTFTARVLPWSVQRKWALAPIIILPLVVAIILSIYILAWMNTNISLLEIHSHLKNTSQLVAAAIAMWTISLVSLGVFSVLCLRHSSSLSDPTATTSEPLQHRLEMAEHKSHAFSMHTLSPSSRRPQSAVSESPSMSIYSISPMSSVRNSVSQFLRPTNSRSRLVQSKDALSIRSDSFLEPRQSDGFETWEVTENEPTVTAAQIWNHQRLETIPGSRPVSPAYPLQGPFPEDAEPEEIPLPDSPPQVHIPRSPNLSSSTIGSFSPFAPSMSRRPSTQDQSHIHPLFRSGSPVPPPTASPGTILTASPFAGQIIDPEYVLASRSRKGSAISTRSSSPALSMLREGHGLTVPDSVLSISRPVSFRNLKQAGTRPRVAMSPSLGDLRAERDRLVRSPLPILHKRENSA